MSTLVTAGPPTANGDLHLGHLSGPYTAGDILTRYLQMRGQAVTYISAADDHQSYVALRAQQLGRSPQDVADEFGRVIDESLKSADVAMSFFGQPSRSRRYIELVQSFVRVLYAKGAIVRRRADVPHCSNCDRLLFEAHIKGQCSYCGESSDGGICEACGRPNAGSDLKMARCTGCGECPDSTRSVERLYFPLGVYRDYVSGYVKSAVMSSHARAVCESLLADKLPDVAVTQPGDWGISVPVDGFEDQRISAWFELGPHYLGVTDMLQEGQGGKDWRGWWTGSHGVIQCFGFDSAYFHIILFPALFRAFDPTIRPPRGFIVNEFYRLDGRKFSTSRKHALWAGEFLKQQPSDAVRFHLCLTRPEAEQTNFTLAEYQRSLQGELIDVWDGWLIGLAARLTGKAPSAQIRTHSQLQFYQRLADIVREVEASYELAGFSSQRAVRKFCELVREARALAADNAHQISNPDGQADYLTGIALELAAARTLAMIAWPIMPRFAETLWADLGQTKSIDSVGWETKPSLLSPGLPVALSESGYFSRLSRGAANVIAA